MSSYESESMPKKSKKRGSGPTLASQADRHVLYQKSVQDPETEVELLEEKFRELRGKKPYSLREDFCGTAFLSVEWCKSHPRRTAVGVDLCADTIAWGREHNLEPAGAKVAKRVNLIVGDVLNTPTDPVDLTCAFNFSYNGFKTREQLLAYFRAVHQNLNDRGVLAMDIHGGPESMDEVLEDREVEGEDFTYIWEQERFNPITHDTVCHIHFEFPDGSRLDRAFSYEWRLWTLPEVRELLTEAGFSKVHVFWEEFEDSDEDSEYLEGTGHYIEVTEVDNQESWVSYILAEK